MFNEVSFFQSYIWGHDINLFNYGCNLDVGSILTKWSSRISGCVCQTEWHKNLFESHYPELKGKIATINNGIQIDKFVSKNVKTTNRFVYTSCSERGLDRLLELWPQIIESLPDAELFIASYNKFPHNDYEHKLNDIIKKQDSITHVGSLNKDRSFVNTNEMLEMSTNIFKKAKEHDIKCYLGGAISIYSKDFIQKLLEHKLLDKFETRYIIFDCCKIDITKLDELLYLANVFEVEWLKYINLKYSLLANKDINRIKMIEERINTNKH